MGVGRTPPSVSSRSSIMRTMVGTPRMWVGRCSRTAARAASGVKWSSRTRVPPCRARVTAVPLDPKAEASGTRNRQRGGVPSGIREARKFPRPCGEGVVGVGDHLRLGLGAGGHEDAGGAVGVGPGGDERRRVGAHQPGERHGSLGDRSGPGGDHVPHRGQGRGQRAQVGGVVGAAVFDRGDDGDGLGAAQEALGLQAAAADGEGQGHRAEGRDREVGDDGAAVVGELYADHVARAHAQVAQAGWPDIAPCGPVRCNRARPWRR